jgi:membrane fusion protein (multidrug efflux system)
MRNALSLRPQENGVMAETVLKTVPRQRDETPDRVRTLPAGPATADSKIKRMRRRPRWPLTRKERVRWALFALLPLALILGGYWYVAGGKIMSTDDAYVDARKVGISTDVAGIVQGVDVADNQHVSEGHLLYRLDPKQFQIALDNANANLKQTALSIDAMKQDYQHMLSDAAAEEAQVALDQTNYDRDAKLLRSGPVSQAIYDQAQYTLQTDKSKLGLIAPASADAARPAGWRSHYSDNRASAVSPSADPSRGSAARTRSYRS